MGFIDHLMELRKRLWISVLAVVVCMGLALFYYEIIFDLLRGPLDDINNGYRKRADYAEILEKLHLPAGSDILPFTSITMLGTMMMVMWLGIGAGLVLSSPVLVYEVWAFVSPGLHTQEKRAVRPILYGGIIFFLIGCVIAYFILFPVTLQFVVWLDVKLKVRPSYTVDDYMSLLLNMMLISGLICETPLVVAVLAKLKIVKPSYLTRYWRPCVLAAFIFGSLLSPGTDVISMLVFSTLLLSIYIISVLMAYVFYPKDA